jgi:O-antigen/teichoic acid export membrane protein
VALALQILLSASGEHTRRTASMAAGLAAAAVANIVLIPSYGIIGAATARVIADLVGVRALAGAPKLPVAGRAVAGWILGPVVLGATAYVLAQLLPVHFVLQFAAAIAAYALGLLSTRMVHVDELRELTRMVRLAPR